MHAFLGRVWWFYSQMQGRGFYDGFVLGLFGILYLPILCMMGMRHSLMNVCKRQGLVVAVFDVYLVVERTQVEV